ncbi:MAG TPA: hypothetical protein DCZ69_08505 [Syntrophobacteraceae bacterium]|nr:hypothetical protein [Syntrophobacteraceae bacterium]
MRTFENPLWPVLVRCTRAKSKDIDYFVWIRRLTMRKIGLPPRIATQPLRNPLDIHLLYTYTNGTDCGCFPVLPFSQNGGCHPSGGKDMGLTPAQERVYRFVRDTLREHGVAPSYEEIREYMGFRSINAVTKHIRQLEQRGYLQNLGKHRKRALELVPLRTSVAAIPFLGVVVAGIPIEAVEVPESIEVPESFLGSGNNFALRVRGESMIEEGIREGDILIITRQAHADNGQTVVALIRGEATVKKFFRHGEEVELRPANSRMEPLRFPADEVEIVGMVVGLLRNYRASFAGTPNRRDVQKI